MKRAFTLWIVLAALLIFTLAAFVWKPAPPVPAKRKAVVVELFTSEGCSSCPPADALLSRLGSASSANDAEVIPLGFHVDYWDHQGWKDRFDSHDYTERQEQYAARFQTGPYTPQLVVDGQVQLVGSDASRAANAISQSAGREQQADVQISWRGPDQLEVLVTAEQAPSAQVVMAITEDDLSSNVAAGENGGRVLHHSAVVRNFRVLGQLSHGRWQGEVPVSLSKDWKKKDLRLVVFVQSAPIGPIDGAASITFSK